MYLRACNQLFERGILKTGFIKCVHSPFLTTIKKGFQFFSEWADKLILEGTCKHCMFTFTASYITPGYDFSRNSERMFISYQTWDFLRIMYYGFVGFCTDFLEKHPGYTVYPIRMNGSAVETVFSQLKYVTGGNLISTNYASARSSILLRGCISKEMITEMLLFLYASIHSKKDKQQVLYRHKRTHTYYMHVLQFNNIIYVLLQLDA